MRNMAELGFYCSERDCLSRGPKGLFCFKIGRICKMLKGIVKFGEPRKRGLRLCLKFGDWVTSPYAENRTGETPMFPKLGHYLKNECGPTMPALVIERVSASPPIQLPSDDSAIDAARSNDEKITPPICPNAFSVSGTPIRKAAIPAKIPRNFCMFAPWLQPAGKFDATHVPPRPAKHATSTILKGQTRPTSRRWFLRLTEIGHRLQLGVSGVRERM